MTEGPTSVREESGEQVQIRQFTTSGKNILALDENGQMWLGYLLESGHLKHRVIWKKVEPPRE